MKVIVGLGNPGKKYEGTRHNVGFFVIDHLAKRWGVDLTETKFQALYGSKVIHGEKVFLLKPLTYMNLSGEALRPFLDYYKMDIGNIVVIYDDLDLPVGTIRLRLKGGHGGHNGMKSIIERLGTNHFKRVRIGIGRPEHEPVVDYVLGKFSEEDKEQVEQAVEKAADACEYWLTNDFDEVMNKFN